MREPALSVAAELHRAGRHAVTRLALTDFRCYRSLRLEVGPAPVVLTGSNGAGKTNLLEAISFLAPGRGLRRARLREIDRRDAGAERAWAVAATVATPAGPARVGTGRDPSGSGPGGERRLIRIEERPARNQAELAEQFSLTWLTPEMDQLFVDGATARRRFFDRLIYGFDPGHAGRLIAYNRALRERARLLGSGGRDQAWLGVLEDTMARQGVAVAAARRETARRLDRAPGVGPFPRAGVAIRGAVEDWLGEVPALEAEDRLRARLMATRRQDAEAGGASLGPHRSDLEVHHLPTGIPAAQCSTGEQKALLIALVLAGARLQAVERDRVPILLLDEVAAHLDETRRRALFDEITALGAQAWLTGVEPVLFEDLDGRARFFRVHEATVTPQ
ncbi:MAG: DNA replication/repair protein RecF [Alphaproteobacteria bacterium]